jgi:23S rRNA pseudouridine1911/1915/1917 synthase
VVEGEGAASLVRVRIETGRTHQIRVHMAHIGCPVVGDRTYGSRKRDAQLPPAPRQMLHAVELGFEHPRTGEAITCRAPLPDDISDLLETLRRNAWRASKRS